MTADPSASRALRVAGLGFAWRRGAEEILRIALLEVARGERVFIEGPSGSGKSTLLSILGGVIRPQRGEVTLLGTDLATLGERQRDRFRADHIGIVFQLFNLVPYLRVLDNVTLPCRFSAARRARAQGARPLEDEARRLLDALELGGDGFATRAATELSIGQQQRVAAARALIGAPAFVIADEPTSALDEATRERFLALLFAECERAGTTVLFVSHDARLGPLFDRRVRLGELNEARPPEMA